MNCIIFRIIIIILLKFVCNHIGNQKIKYCYFIFFILICIYPIENKVFKFNSSDKAFSYYYPTSKILKKYECNNYVYIVYEPQKNKLPEFMYLIKEDGTWKINNLITKGEVIPKIFDEICTMYIIKPKKSESIGIAVYHDKDGSDGAISDSLSSNFDKFTTNLDEISDEDVDVVILKKKVDKDYTIYLNGNEYKPFANK